jgi:DNA-binding NarL/FixJ family response regulator
MANTILIADDHDAFRHALCEALKRESDFEVCGEARDGQDAVDQAQHLHPDLVIMDLSMPVMNGLDASRALKKLMPSVPIILFTLNVYPFLEVEAQAAGIAAVVSKSAGMSGLIPSARGLLYRSAA